MVTPQTSEVGPETKEDKSLRANRCDSCQIGKTTVLYLVDKGESLPSARNTVFKACTADREHIQEYYPELLQDGDCPLASWGAIEEVQENAT